MTMKQTETRASIDDLGLFWCEEQLILIAGAPFSGTSAFAVQSCLVANVEGNGPAVYFSLCANSWNIRKLLVLQQAKRSGEMNSIQDLRNMPAIPVYLEDFDQPPIEKLVERIFYFKKEKGARFFVIDFLQLIDCQSLGYSNLNRESDLDNALGLLHCLARVLGVIIMVISQLSQHWSTRGYPVIRDILDVSEAEDHCNQILFIHYPAEQGVDPGTDSRRTILIAKSYFDTDDNDDEMASLDMHLDLNTMTFSRIRPGQDKDESMCDFPDE